MLDEIHTKLNTGDFDFLDFGSSTGGSVKFATEVLGGVRGLGLDMDPKKVEAANKAGAETVLCDVTKVDQFPNAVSFVVMSHFLEHLSGYRAARRCIESAIATARDFVFIKQPWFDSDGYLFEHGLKLYWSDWRGHDFQMNALHFQRAIRDVKGADKIKQWRIYARRPIIDSNDLAIHPLTSTFDRQAYKEELDGPKPLVKFDQSVYYEIICVMRLSDARSIDEIMSKVPHDKLLYEGNTVTGQVSNSMVDC